jgi:hypothetical protein
MMKLKSAIFAVVACALHIEGTSAANVVIGDCNNILTLNFGDRQTVLSAIRTEYPSADLTDINVIVEIAGCHDQITDPKRRAELLIFSLNEMILIKENVFLPAIDVYINNPTEANFSRMVSTSHGAVRKIDSAIDTLMSYQAAVMTASTLSPSRLPADQKRLDDTQAQLQAQLQSRLQIQLEGPLRGAKSLPNPGATREVMIQFRNQYAGILADIKVTINQMINQLRQVQAR